MTVSRDFTCDADEGVAADTAARARAIAALDDLTPRRSPDAPVRLVPAPTADDAGGWLRRSVDAVRRALADGTLHHHPAPADEAPEPRAGRTPRVEVVRAWAAGHGLAEQRRCCPTCTAEDAADAEAAGAASAP